MKSMKILPLLLAAVLAFGCRDSGEKVNEGAAGDPGTETTGTAGATENQPLTDTGATGGTSSVLSSEDREFVVKAASGGMAEVAMAQMAKQKATNSDVKNFAEKMETDHGKANQELSSLATTKGLALPTQTDADHKAGLDHLNGLTGTAFDKSYMQHMVDDHTKTVADFEKAAQSASDPDLKAWVTKTLPTLKEHLQLAQSTQNMVP